MTLNTKPVLLGAHMSIEGGLYKALDRGAEIGCTAIQIFTTSNRQWGKKELAQIDIDRFKKKQRELNILVISHCSYLINIGSPTPSIQAKSLEGLKQELARCNALGIKYAVLHPGSRLDSTEEVCIHHIAKNIDHALQSSDGSTMILLETMAGQGTTIGNSFEQLDTIRSLADSKKLIGVCLDTCHIFASGYTFSTEKDYKDLMDEFNKKIGLSHLKALHMNDSKKDCGEHIDRHEDIGKGKIGIDAFRHLMNDPRLENVPKILETPKLTLQDDVRNLENLRKLISPEKRK